MQTDDLGENIAIHRSVWHNVVKDQCKTASSGTELAPAMAYRRGLASKLQALGIDDMLIQRVLRHSDVSTTQRSYIRVRDETMYDAMLQLGLAFDACTASVQPKDTPKSVN